MEKLNLNKFKDNELENLKDVEGGVEICIHYIWYRDYGTKDIVFYVDAEQ